MLPNYSPSDGDMLFSVDIDNYDDVDIVAFDSTVIHKIGKFKDLVEDISQPKGSLARFLNDALNPKLGMSTWWGGSGTDCEILKASGKGWKKGKIKFELTVKFYPDESEIDELPTSDKQKLNQTESTLDDIRLRMDKLR